MALDKEKLEEESTIHRFYKIILAWDYVTLEAEAIHSPFLFFFPFPNSYLLLTFCVFVCVSE